MKNSCGLGMLVNGKSPCMPDNLTIKNVTLRYADFVTGVNHRLWLDNNCPVNQK